MKSDFFIDRPIFSMVISILIVLVGVIGVVLLPVDQYPQIVPPVVKVSATYPGAGAETVSQAIAAPIEQVLNGNLYGVFFFIKLVVFCNLLALLRSKF